MKQFLLSILLSIVVINLHAQTNTTTTKPAAKPAPILKTLNDSASYAVGYSVANFYKQQGITKLNTTLVSKGINDVLGNKKPLCNEETANNVMTRFMGKTKDEKPKLVPGKPASILKTLSDSGSYVIGMSAATFYKRLDVTKLNTIIVSKAINDVLTGKNPLCNDESANMIMNNYMTKIQEQKSRPAIEAGTKFLAQNKLRTGVITTASGLQYEIITQGNGAKPQGADSVTCNYKGTLLDGTVFDDSYARGQPITFSLNGVIRGWTECLQLMNTGSKYKLYVPYDLAYGAFDYGGIPGGSMLTFEIELLEVKKAP